MFYLQSKFFRLLFLPATLISIVILLVNPIHAANKSKTKSQIIDIQAQYLLLDKKNGISKYKGNVVFKRDSLIIKAETITLYYNGDELTKALITGSPADVKHQPDNEPKVHSQANKMEFFVTEDRLILKGQAFVDQGSRHFSGEFIEYDTRQGTITAAGSQNDTVNAENSKNNPPKGRVHVIIGPSNDVEENVNDKNKDEIEHE